MSNFTDSAQSKQIDQHEHNSDASAKRIIVRAFDSSSGDWVNIGADDNGDGTFALKTTATISGNVNVASSFSDSGGIDRKALVDGDRHAQVDVLSMPAVSISTTGLATDTKQDTIIGHIDGVETTLTAIDTVLDTIKVDTEAIETAVEAIQAGQLPDGHNVTVDNASIAVTATDLDIRNLTATDVVTANLSATDNAVLDSIDTKLTTINNAQLPDGHNVTIDNPGDIGGGVQYTAGDTDTSITGTAILWEDSSNTLRVPSSSKPLPVEPLIGGAVLAGNTGNANNNTQRVVIASDQPSVTVDDGGTSLTVDATSLPLPTGASTSANQSTIIGHIDGVEGLLTTIDADTSTLASTDFATEAKQDDIITAIGAIPGGGGTQYADGAAQATPTGTVALGYDGSNVQALATDASGNLQVDVLNSSIPVTDNGGSLTVDGTVAVSGTVTVDGSGVTQPISAASLPLPTGAATTSKQDDIISAINNITVPAPVGGATEAEQQAQTALLTTIDADTSALAGAVSGTELQVDIVSGVQTDALTDTQLRATPVSVDTGLTPLTDTQLRATPVPVSGTVTANTGLTQPLTDTQLRATAVPISGTVTANTGLTQPTTPSDTQPVSASSLPLPTGAATAANQQTDALTDTELRASPVVVDLGSNNDVTITGTVTTQEIRPATPAVANVTMTGSSVTLQALNNDRKGLYIFNDSGVTVYVKCGTSASATSFTIKMVDQSYYELPQPIYTGLVTALGASGEVRVTEID